MRKLTLTVTVTPRKTTGKVKVVTDVTIRLDGGRALAFKTLGGRHTAATALKEFERAPERFEPQSGHTTDDLLLAALAC